MSLTRTEPTRVNINRYRHIDNHKRIRYSRIPKSNIMPQWNITLLLLIFTDCLYCMKMFLWFIFFTVHRKRRCIVLIGNWCKIDWVYIINRKVKLRHGKCTISAKIIGKFIATAMQPCPPPSYHMTLNHRLLEVWTWSSHACCFNLSLDLKLDF